MTRTHRALMRLTRFLPMREIRINEEAYLERYHVLKLGRLEIRLHRFVSGDGERHLHDHPFAAACLILAGGYVEERTTSLGQVVQLAYRAGDWNFIRSNRGLDGTVHRIARTDPNTWTLNITWRTGTLWGFHEQTQRVGWRYEKAPESDVRWYRSAGKRQEVRA